MKRFSRSLMALALVCAMIFSSAALAEGENHVGIAVDSTVDCTFKGCPSGTKISALSDRKLKTVWASNAIANPWVEIYAPSGVPIYGLFIKFGKAAPSSYEIQREVDGAWEKVFDGTGLIHDFYQFPEGEKHLRIMVSDENPKSVLSISEIYTLTDGAVPDWVETWHTAAKADAVVYVGRVGDECSIYGSLIPTICDKEVVVASFSCPSTDKRSEMLSALWKMGLRTMPEIRIGKQTASESVESSFRANGGEYEVSSWVMEIMRKYQPEVVFAPAAGKEDGAYQRGMIGESAATCFNVCNDETQFIELSLTYGAWEPKKLYIHGGDKLSATEEQEALAKSAYESYTHEKTDKKYDECVEKYGGNAFTLAANKTDGSASDIFSGVEVTDWTPDSAPKATVRKEEVPYYTTKLPELNSRGFLDEGEFVYESEEEGLYIFVNTSCKVVVTKKVDKSQPLVWWDAEFWTDIENGVIPGNYWYDDVKKAKVVKNAIDTAGKQHLAFAMNTDYFYYRTASSGSKHVGVVVRDGQIVYDDRFDKPTGAFPNMDTLAVYSDGRMEALDGTLLSAQEYIDRGAVTVYSFGPWMIHEGQVRENLAKISHSNNPRCALGMIEPGHYVAILCEGRLTDSVGISVTQLALMMRARGCVEACNMDGGQTCVFIFMGKQLNRIGKYGGRAIARDTTDVLGIGVTDKVQPKEKK